MTTNKTVSPTLGNLIKSHGYPETILEHKLVRCPLWLGLDDRESLLSAGDADDKSYYILGLPLLIIRWIFQEEIRKGPGTDRENFEKILAELDQAENCE